MASNQPPDTSLFIDTAIQQDPSLTNTSLNTSPNFDLSNFSPSDLFSLIPGAGTLSDLLKVIGNLPGFISTLLADVEGAHPLNWMAAIIPHAANVAKMVYLADLKGAQQQQATTPALGPVLEADAAASWKFWTDHSLGYFFRGMLEGGLGVDVTKFDDDGKLGVGTVDSMLGFSFLLQFIVMAADTIGSGLFGGRWADAFKDTIGKIPEEMGLSWALGLTIDEAFKTAVGASIEEGINRQKRGNRIGWPQIRQLLKAHVLDEFMLSSQGKIVPNPNGTSTADGVAVFEDLMKAAGFPDSNIEMLKSLDDVSVPVGDIAQLWYRDIIDDATAKKLIARLGFNEQQVGWLFDLYVDKSENEASVTYRSIARQMFTNHLIPESQYRSILSSANYPAKLIDQDVAAITFEQSVGRVLESVAVVKSLYQHKQINSQEAQTRLRSLNYSDTYIGQLIQTWDLPALRAKHGLSQAKILSYVISGIPLNPPALDQLMATGLDQASAQFLLDHPHANTGVHQHQLTPGLVTQAFLDGAITQAGLGAAYTAAGVPQADLAYYEDIAKYKLAHHRGSPTYTQTLTDADIRAGFKQGLIDFQTGVSMLQQNGWDSHDAMFLMEITNKGPYKAPLFADLQAAIAYLQGLMYIIVPPPDPRLSSALAIVEGAGYGVIAPAEGGGTVGTFPGPLPVP